MGAALPSNNHRQWSLFQPVKDVWSLSFPPTALNVPFSSHLHADGLTPWTANLGEPCYTEDTIPTNIPCLLLLVHDYQAERWPSQHEIDPDARN